MATDNHSWPEDKSELFHSWPTGSLKISDNLPSTACETNFLPFPGGPAAHVERAVYNATTVEATRSLKGDHDQEY